MEEGYAREKSASFSPIWDFYDDVKRSSRNRRKTRKDVLQEVLRNFTSVYEEETGKTLSKNAEGIVVFQQGYYPFDKDITINPNKRERCLYTLISCPNKILKKDYVFESHTFWLRKGASKIIHLLDSQDVLLDAKADNAASFIAKELNCDRYPDNMGIHIVELVKGHSCPCRLYRINTEQYVLMNMLNGVVSILSNKDLSLKGEVENKYEDGEVSLKKETRCWVRY